LDELTLSARARRGHSCQIEQRVPLAGHRVVELDDQLGEHGLRRAERADRVGRLGDAPDVLRPQRMWYSRLGEQSATAAFGSEPRVVGVGTVQRDIEGERDVAFNGRRVVWHQVGGVRSRERASDVLEDTGSCK
jgi:hypothetical protein